MRDPVHVTECLHLRRNAVKWRLRLLYIEHDVFGLIPHHLEDRVHAGDVIQGIYALIRIGRVGPTRCTSFEHRFCNCRLVYFT